jgi:ElaB/YqjD/DUF883 family membrane-anchored ribosome-binding protein
MATTTPFNQTKQDDLKSKVQDTAHSMGNQAKDAAHSMGNQAKDAAQSMTDRAKDAAHNISDKAKDAAQSVADRARDAASNLGSRAEDATHRVGKGMESLAGTIREKLPNQGVLGAAGSSVASSLESSGRYLEEEGISGMAEDVTQLIRRNPVPAVLVGIALGFLIARITSSRS